MSKRVPPFAGPEVALDPHATAPLYRQIYERLRGQILTGCLGAGTRLPSTRSLAATLGVSRTTTALAYDLLLQEGYIESRVGDGTRVARLHAEGPEPVPGAQPDPHTLRGCVSRRGGALAELPYPEEVAVLEA